MKAMKFTSILKSSVETLGLDATSKIVERLLLNLVNDPKSSETEASTSQIPAHKGSASVAVHNVAPVEIKLSSATASSTTQTARRSKRPTRPQQSRGKRLKYKRFPTPRSLFDCKDGLHNGSALVARFRDGEHDYVIRGIEGSIAFVPDGYITSRGKKTEIDLNAAHHFWTVLGELPLTDNDSLPMVRGRAYLPQRPLMPYPEDVRVGSVLTEDSTGAIAFVAELAGYDVAIEDENGVLRRIPLDTLPSAYTLIGHSQDFEEEIAARA